MISLFLDSACRDLAVGISIDDKLVYNANYPCWQRQSELMIPEIEKALKSVNITLLDVDEVICGKGPGSYTGVRIAMTIAKTIGAISNKKIKLISSLKIQGKKEKKYISLMNARSQRSYIGAYDKGKTILEDTIFTNEEVKSFIGSHPDFEVLGDVNYLGLDSKEFNLVEGMFSYKDEILEEKEVLSIKPVYLKD